MTVGSYALNCRTCAHWTGVLAHVVDERAALCRRRTREHAEPATYADDVCAQYKNADRGPR